MVAMGSCAPYAEIVKTTMKLKSSDENYMMPHVKNAEAALSGCNVWAETRLQARKGCRSISRK